MQTALKILATCAVFGLFYAGAFVLLNGAKEFEKKGEMALFTNKAEAAAIANVERDKNEEHKAQVSVASSVWR